MLPQRRANTISVLRELGIVAIPTHLESFHSYPPHNLAYNSYNVYFVWANNWPTLTCRVTSIGAGLNRSVRDCPLSWYQTAPPTPPASTHHAAHRSQPTTTHPPPVDSHHPNPASPSPTTAHAGSDWRWRKLSARMRKLSPFCEKCGSKNKSSLTVDHVIPVSDDATLAYEPLNLRVYCQSCNASRSTNVTDNERAAVYAAIQARKQRQARY